MCVLCRQPTDHFDPESQLEICPECLDAWWVECEPLPAPIVIRCRNGPDVVVSRGVAQDVWNSEDDPDQLRRRGVFTAA